MHEVRVCASIVAMGQSRCVLLPPTGRFPPFAAEARARGVSIGSRAFSVAGATKARPPPHPRRAGAARTATPFFPFGDSP